MKNRLLVISTLGLLGLGLAGCQNPEEEQQKRAYVSSVVSKRDKAASSLRKAAHQKQAASMSAHTANDTSDTSDAGSDSQS